MRTRVAVPRPLLLAGALMTIVLSATFLPGPGWAQPSPSAAVSAVGAGSAVALVRGAEPVEWLPQPADPDPVRGRSFSERLRRGAESFRAEREPPARFPIDGEHDYGEAQAAFGVARPGHTHEGQDLFAADGTPLVAVRDGVVLEAGSDGGRGNYLGIYSPEADETYVYLHLNAPARVEGGDRVAAGDRLGGVGCTGSCSGPHLHFEVRTGRGLDREPVDPLGLLRRLERGRGR